MAYRVLQGCPRCGRYPLRPSHLHGRWDRLRHHLTQQWPFRCPACQWRGWAHRSWDRRQHADRALQRLRRRAGDRPAGDPDRGAGS